MRTYTCTIDGKEVEADVEVTGYHPAESPTWDDPGCGAEVEFDVVGLRIDGELAQPDDEFIGQVTRAIYDDVLVDEEREIGEARADHIMGLRELADQDAAAWRDGRGW